MSQALTLIDTKLGRKAAMAVTGLVLYGFVIGHMLGNLQVFGGPELLNGYAEMLRSLGGALWAARGVLILSVIIHAVFAMQLVSESAAARPVGYRQKQNLRTGYAAITMKLSGPMLAAFIVYHLAHFTFPGVSMDPAYEHSTVDVYANVVNGFNVPWVTAVYLVAQVLLGLHLYHGAWSLLQTLGLSHPRYNGMRQAISRGIALFVVVGNLSIPLAVLAGVITL